ncbi:MAG: hypothetical protein MZV65_32845 [Chromatiales bacterium]|nr:hypothetical protein [Chromatiales bacterium]
MRAALPRPMAVDILAARLAASCTGTSMLTLAIGAVIVMVMKGPAYVADATLLAEDADGP